MGAAGAGLFFRGAPALWGGLGRCRLTWQPSRFASAIPLRCIHPRIVWESVVAPELLSVRSKNVVLPLSEDVMGQRRYGTRHRAAKGISEQSDAISVVVSEETGAISLMNDGRMVSYLNEARLRNMLAGLLKVSLEENAK